MTSQLTGQEFCLGSTALPIFLHLMENMCCVVGSCHNTDLRPASEQKPSKKAKTYPNTHHPIQEGNAFNTLSGLKDTYNASFIITHQLCIFEYIENVCVSLCFCINNKQITIGYQPRMSILVHHYFLFVF